MYWWSNREDWYLVQIDQPSGKIRVRNWWRNGTRQACIHKQARCSRSPTRPALRRGNDWMSAQTRKEDAFAVPLLKLRTLACKRNATPKLDPPRQVRCNLICYQRSRSTKEQYEYEWLFPAHKSDVTTLTHYPLFSSRILMWAFQSKALW